MSEMLRPIPRPEHPQPQWERKNWKNLNGVWDFEIDRSVSGEERGLIEAPALSGKINVPFCPESSLSGVADKDFMDCVWYKKTVSFTAEELQGKRVLFHIGACDYETKVWVNGKSAGFPHRGGYTPVDYDITPHLQAGDNLITVAVFDHLRSFRQPGGKQSAKFDSYGCYYTRTTGIWQTVWYEIVPENYLKYAKITPDLENASVMIEAELCGSGDFSAEVYFDGRKVGEGFKKNKSVTAQLEIRLSECHAWELGKGGLYDLILRFGEDEVKSYFGLRSIEMKDGKFLLNGKSVFQRLILDQGYYHDGVTTAPSDEALCRDIEISMAAGFNGARMHQKVFEPRYIYHADRLGYMVWGEYGSWSMDITALESAAIYLPEWLESVRRDYNHPALIGWCPFNETWDIDGREQANEILSTIYEETKRIDPVRPCIDTSGNYHVVTDIYDIHDYNQSVETYQKRYAAITDTEVFENMNKTKVRQQYGGQPYFISEYGGIKWAKQQEVNNNQVSWGYGDAPKSIDEYVERFVGLTGTLMNTKKVCGLCYTQLYDVEQEQNGVYYYDRSVKFDDETMDKLAAVLKKKAAIEEE